MVNFGHIDLVLVDGPYDILYTKINDDGQMYIVVNCWRDGEKVVWMIAETTPEKVVDLLSDRLMCRDIFLGVPLWMKVRKVGKPKSEIFKVNADEIEQSLLPTAGYYMEVDPGEFDKEIEILRQRIKNKEKKYG